MADGATRQLALAQCHLFERCGKRVLFNVETLLGYEVTPVVYDLVSLLAGKQQTDPFRFLLSRYGEDEVRQAVLHLKKERVLKEVRAGKPAPRPVLKKRWGIRHLELMVTHDCNLRCRYCYGVHGPDQKEPAPFLYGARTGGMSLDVAQRGVDFLMTASGPQKQLSVIFFGGEPLLAMDLIKQIIPYIRQKASAAGKEVDLSLSTNGTLLTPAIVSFLVKNRIGCQISIDGPELIHDYARRRSDGGGSYQRLQAALKPLLAARPGKVPARATISHGMVRMPEVLEHLLRLGFGSVHIEPALGQCGDLTITAEDLPAIKQQQETIARFLVRSVRKNRFFNCFNLVRYIRQTKVVRERLGHHCGAARTYLALAQDGSFYPCHRFVGMAEYRMGDLDSGFDRRLQQRILGLTVDDRPGCRECWARYLCGGGCWKHAVDRNGCLERPDLEVSCELIKHQIECSLAINSQLKDGSQQVLSRLYEQTAEPYLVPERKRKP